MICHLRVAELEFPAEDVERAVREKGLLSLELELGENVRFHSHEAGERSVLAQARALGARRLILRGEEPMLYPRLLQMLGHARGQGLQVEMVTSGSRIDSPTAERLFGLEVQVVLRRSSLLPEIQDRLAGRAGAHAAVEAAYRNLRQAGYPGGGRVLGISSMICRENQAEISRLWRWIRGEGLAPYLDVALPHDGVPREELPAAEYQATLVRLAAWDRENGGPDWDAEPPFAQNRCLRHLFSCVVDAEGSVLPCAGVRIPVGSLRERSLREILEDSEVVQNLRESGRRIAGPCASCAGSERCHGCRGAAYAETGDYLASDPSCWHNRERLDEIARMPLEAAALIPQRDPMRLVDALRSVGERRATATVTVRAEMPFVGSDGRLAEAAYLEMMAQAGAAMGGFAKRGKGGQHEEGLMLGARNLEILGEARIGDELEIDVFKSARLGEFGILEGQVRRQGQILARGEIKILQLGPRGDS